MLTSDGMRRSERLLFAVPVIVSGKDATGCYFRETSRTIAINSHGGLIATSHGLATGSQIQIENPALSRTAIARVVSACAGHTQGTSFEVAVEVDGAAYLWPVEFFWLGAWRSPENAEPASVEAVGGRAA